MKKTVLAIALAVGLALPTSATAGTAATAASAKAKHRYERVTHRHALHWRTGCRRRVSAPVWRCRSQVWNGAYRGFYDIRVKNGVARIVAEGYVR